MTAANPSRGFRPTPAQIHAAENLCVAMAHEQTVRPIVEGYETAILAKHQFRIAPKWVEKGREDSVILDRKLSYLLSDADAAVFYRECYAARDAAGLKVEDPEHCALLVAQHARIDAENAVFDAFSTTPGMEVFAKRYTFTLETRAKALDLILKLIVPFVSSTPEILRRLAL